MRNHFFQSFYLCVKFLLVYDQGASQGNHWLFECSFKIKKIIHGFPIQQL